MKYLLHKLFPLLLFSVTGKHVGQRLGRAVSLKMQTSPELHAFYSVSNLQSQLQSSSSNVSLTPDLNIPTQKHLSCCHYSGKKC